MEVETLLKEMIRREASDLHLTADASAFLRVDGKLEPQDCVTKAALDRWLADVLPRAAGTGRSVGDGIDFSLTTDGRRLRGNAYRTEGTMAVALRLLPERIPTLCDIGAPPSVAALAQATQGAIFAVGRTGAGKSTTLAALLLALAEARKRAGTGLHCITLEDPIEFRYRAAGCLFHQLHRPADAKAEAGAFGDPDTHWATFFAMVSFMEAMTSSMPMSEVSSLTESRVIFRGATARWVSWKSRCWISFRIFS